MKKIAFLLCLAISSIVYSQQLPIDFSNDNHIFYGFAGSDFAFRTVSPSSNANRGGQFNNNGTDQYQGFYIDLASPLIIDDSNKVFSLRFYAFDPNNHSILLKLENPGGATTDVQVRTSFSVPSPSDWITLTLDFNNAVDSADGTTSVNANGSYSRLTLFVDDGSFTSGTYIIDDINNGATANPPDNPNAIDVVYNDLVWTDEFDGPNGNIDNSKWFHQTQLPAGGNWFNGEEQHYTDRLENSKIEDGFLVITAKKESYTDQGETKQYTSARLNSKFAFTYGRVDVRAKLPFGEGTWPAIWMLGKNISEEGAYWDNQGFGTTSWPECGEIDIMEHGLHATNEVSVALHTPSSFGATVNNAQQFLTDVANNFHVYSMNWSPEKIVFLIDDVPFYTYNPPVKNANTWPFMQDQYILLNIAMGGVSGAIAPSFTESPMIIDYVRVYQNNALNTSDTVFNNLNVYPNPADDVINISSNSVIDKVEVYNLIGQLVFTQQGNTNQLQVSHLNSGMYVLKMFSGNTSSAKKIFIK